MREMRWSPSVGQETGWPLVFTTSSPTPKNRARRLVRNASSQPARLNLPRGKPLVVSLCMALIAMWRRTARLWGSVAQSGPVLILVHDNAEPPVQPVLDAPGVGVPSR
jgi:hypothetical protein